MSLLHIMQSWSVFHCNYSFPLKLKQNANHLKGPCLSPDWHLISVVEQTYLTWVKYNNTAPQYSIIHKTLMLWMGYLTTDLIHQCHCQLHCSMKQFHCWSLQLCGEEIQFPNPWHQAPFEVWLLLDFPHKLEPEDPVLPFDV